MDDLEHGFTLSPEGFARAFPFHFIISRDLRLGPCGSACAKISADLRPGVPLDAVLELVEPSVGTPDAATLDACVGALCVWKTRAGGHRLRGELIRDERHERWVFLGTPWLRDTTELEQLGLSLADFARHDASADLLMLLGVQRTAMTDLRRLASHLQERNRALREAEQERGLAMTRLLTLLGSLHGAVLLEDADRRIVLVNEAFCRLFSIPVAPAALVGVDCSRAADEAKSMFRDPHAFVSRIETLLAEKRRALDDELVTTDGRTLLRDYVPLWDADRYLGHFWFYRDVSAERHAAALLSERKRRLDDLLASIWDAVLTTSIDGRVTYANPAAARLLGKPETCLIGHPLGELLRERDGPALDATKLIAGWRAGSAERWEQECALVTALGSKTPALVRAGPLIDGRQVVSGVLCVCKDLSAERQADRQKRDFIATVSHELRSPLNAILGMAELLLVEPTMDATSRQRLTSGIQTGGQHLLALVNDLLDHAKLESGGAVVDPVALDPLTELRACYELLRSQAERKGIRLHAPVATGDGAIKADARALRQILLNLLGNAIKFTPPGGEVAFDARAEPERWTITVSDTGVGISAEDQTRLFQPFVQLGDCPNTKASGTGLGLATTRRLLELQDGGIRVESAAGQGSRFIFHLPRVSTPARPTAPRASTAPFPGANAKKLRVLVVEDHDLNREMLTALLELHGCEVTATADGLEAIARTQALQPDLILMDLRMPGIDGLETTRRIRATAAGKRARLVILTGLTGKNVAQDCADAGADDHLIKPIEPAALARVVESTRKPR